MTLIDEGKQEQRNIVNTLSVKESELRYRRLFEAAQDGILILNANTGMIEDVNPFLIDMLDIHAMSSFRRNYGK